MLNWTTVYREIAETLSNFYLQNSTNSGEVLYRMLIRNEQFIKDNPWFKKTFSSKNKSIDPIQIFASFNESRLKNEARQRRINSFMLLFNKRTYKEEINFYGCPAPFSIKILSNRPVKVQSNIWEVFYAIENEGRAALTPEVFDLIDTWYGIDLAAFTIFLFWIDSSSFIALDKNTVTYLLGTGKIQRRPSSYQEYSELLEDILNAGRETPLYAEIVRTAYDFIALGKEDFVMTQALADYLQGLQSQEQIGCKIIAVKALEDLDKKFRKNLTIGHPYTLYSAYDLSDVENIRYNRSKDFQIYKLKQGATTLDVNISAIVGKNGSGKSTITELIYLAVNNLAKDCFKEETDLKFVNDIHVELFFSTNSLYQLSIKGREITLYKYRYDPNKSTFTSKLKVNKKIDTLKDFVYSIAINYSHYALNSKHIGIWIAKLFHKNDSYQTPLVINPKRTKGNININTQNELVKSRLLANILEPVDVSDNNNLRAVTENGRQIKWIKLKLSNKKVAYLSDKLEFPEHGIILDVVNRLYGRLGISPRNEVTIAEKYIYRKLFNIGRTYPQYKVLFRSEANQIKEESLEGYFSALLGDTSHITFKLWQALNYVRFQHLSKYLAEDLVAVEEISNDIESIISDHSLVEKMKTVHLIPPSFLEVEFILNDGSGFEELSSGEKQKIHTATTLVYHLLNINSVPLSSLLVKYCYANIIFDEVELYYHPEMQRTFVSYLLNYLSKASFNDIFSINISFVTHSPFILSDIPEHNILFLDIEDGRAVQRFTGHSTLGSNIHDLLKSNFFLYKGTMGSHAKSIIKRISEYLDNRVKGHSVDNHIEFSQDEIRDIIDNIGEPLIKTNLRILYTAAFLKTSSAIEQEISRLTQLKENSSKRN